MTISRVLEDEKARDLTAQSMLPGRFIHSAGRARGFHSRRCGPENASGDSFGDQELEDIVRRNQSQSPSHLSDDLLTGVRRWQPASVTQQDDITLIVIDITQSPWNAGPEIVETSQASFRR